MTYRFHSLLLIDYAREGRTAQEAERDFLAEFGLTSSTGANASNTPYKDKMILYAAVVVQEGTGDYVGRRSPLQWNQGVLGCVNNAVRQATFVDYCSGQEASIAAITAAAKITRMASGSRRVGV